MTDQKRIHNSFLYITETVHLPIFEFEKIYLRLSPEDSQAEISLKHSISPPS